jgi:hypothetical protein
LAQASQHAAVLRKGNHLMTNKKRHEIEQQHIRLRPRQKPRKNVIILIKKNPIGVWISTTYSGHFALAPDE